MSKLNQLTLLLFICFNVNMKAQESTLKIGPKLKGISNVLDVSISENSLHVLAGDYNSGLSAWKLSPMSLIPNGEPKPVLSSKKKVGAMVANAKELSYYNLFSGNQKSFIFYNKKESKDKTSQLFYQNLDNGFIPTSKPTKLATRNTEGGVKTGLFKNKSVDGGGYDLISNTKGDQLLIVNQAPDRKVDKKVSAPGAVTLSLYNTSDMNEVGSGTFDLGIENFGSDAVLGNDGYVYCLVYVAVGSKEERKEKKKNGEAYWHYKIVGVNLYQSDAKAFEYDLIFKNKGILKASLEVTDNGELVCAGTYSELTKKGNIDDFDGIFYAKLDPKTGAVLSDNQKKLDRETVQFFTSAKNANNDEGVSANFKIRGFEIMENGTSNLILEEDYYYRVTTRTKNGTYTTDHYVSKAIMVANIAGDGEINWIQHIPKHQHTTNDGGKFNSFTYFKDKNTLKFVFADNNRNYDDKTFKLKPDKSKNINEMYVAAGAQSTAYATLDEKGKTTQKLLCYTKKYLLYTRYATWSSSGNEIYFQALKLTPPIVSALGCLFPPFGIYLLMRDASNSIARLELD